ncbi:MAG: DeoR/GlpR transcriptional regulator [Clostridia bacterium]|nr:DeoR/GlpR transcriptional regulator [Clostridia bacterium]
MYAEERQREIAQMIEENGMVAIADLTARYSISSESARRDLRALEQQGLCKRTHGGAIRPQQVSVLPPRDRNFDEMPVFPNYDRIAAHAVSLIRPGDMVYFTGGSFGFLMLRHLPQDVRFTLVVNNADIAARLRPFTNIDVYLAGGRMRPSGSIVDSMAVDFMSRLHFDVAFITGGGLTADFGLSNGTDETAALQRQVIRNARKNVLLMPSQKIGTDAFVKVCDASAFDALITDWDCVEDELLRLEEQGVQVTVVPAPEA